MYFGSAGRDLRNRGKRIGKRTFYLSDDPAQIKRHSRNGNGSRQILLSLGQKSVEILSDLGRLLYQNRHQDNRQKIISSQAHKKNDLEAVLRFSLKYTLSQHDQRIKQISDHACKNQGLEQRTNLISNKARNAMIRASMKYRAGKLHSDFINLFHSR